MTYLKAHDDINFHSLQILPNKLIVLHKEQK